MNEIRILVCGDRNWTNTAFIEEILSQLKNCIFIHGLSRGADMETELIAQKHGNHTMKFPADWERFGRAAGPIRNRQMIIEGRPKAVLAFHNDLNKSKGTANMLKQAREHSIPCFLFNDTRKTYTKFTEWIKTMEDV